MDNCFFVSDLHGHPERYRKLFQKIKEEKPDFVFFGGDLLPHSMKVIEGIRNFTSDFLFKNLSAGIRNLKSEYPEIFIILGNDDARSEEHLFIKADENGLFHYASMKRIQIGAHKVFGYPFIPPTPFQLKDWEKYDVSRYVDPGCVHPIEGFRTIDPNEDIEYATIKNDLEILTAGEDLSNSIFLFHSPPYKTYLDRAGLDGKMVDYVPMDVHVGSIAMMRFIEEKQPLLTLHGHIHESTRLTGFWQQQFGRTFSFNASHDGPELSLIRFNLKKLNEATRELL
ncbi:MAG: metallophosphoesterase [Bacteroidales bacterium]